MNSRGPRTEPCGTPWGEEKVGDKEPSAQTAKELKDVIDKTRAMTELDTTVIYTHTVGLGL